MTGNAKCAFGEIWKNGMIAKEFITKMKQKSVGREGANRTPSAPIISIEIAWRPKPYPAPASHWRLVGTIFGFRYATRKKMMINAVAIHSIAVILVNHG